MNPPVWNNWPLYPELKTMLETSPAVTWAGDAVSLVDLACGGPGQQRAEAVFTLPGGRSVLEATVVRARNGVVVNFPEPYMRRREADCLFIADDLPTDKPLFRDRFGYDFSGVRQETLEWLARQPLIAFAFTTGHDLYGQPAVGVIPEQAACFALSLALLQGILPLERIPADFTPRVSLYVAPPFRHTHFHGKQVVVHSRLPERHEVYSFNLYPGPSAKKGIYGALIEQGEREGWVAPHCSTVQVVTPYDNIVTIMHEGASGGGKSEMLEAPHRQSDGRLLLGHNLVTDEKRYLQLPRSCQLHPVCDDMGLCLPQLQRGDGRLHVIDGEKSWFIRVDHIKEYGTAPGFERITAQPTEPLVFLNIDGVPDGRAMVWEHTLDSPGHPCPNPRVIVPRQLITNHVDREVAIDLRSFGVRTPPCTREKPTYGILGVFHLLPPALAWLWRLAAPRGHNNPSIIETEGGMPSEGIGTYWPFATGKLVRQANLLLEQFLASSRVRYLLCPNQHVGAWQTGFMPEWIAREYMARRGPAAPFNPEQVQPARCPLLGYAFYQLHVEGQSIPRWLLQVHSQPEVGEQAYDQGAAILEEFFRNQLMTYRTDELLPLGREIIDCCLSRGGVTDYEQLLPTTD